MLAQRMERISLYRFALTSAHRFRSRLRSAACRLTRAAFTTLVVSLVTAGCSPAADLPTSGNSEAKYDSGYKARAIQDLGVSPAWGAPELVPGEVNTAGWEDSAYISPDGSTLYFQYFPGDMFRIEDVFRYHRPVEQGGIGGDPKQYGKFHRGPPRGVSPAYTSDTLMSRLMGGKFGDVKRFPFSKDGGNEWGVMQAPDNSYYYVSHDPTRKLNMDLYRNGVPLAIPGREKYNEDNPHFAITRYGRELFFDSNDRPASAGKSHIWLTREKDGKFSEPIMLAAPVNLAGSTEVQPHLAGDGRLYFTSARGGVIAIYASPRTGSNAWGEPEKILWPTKSSGPRVWGVGEPTLTADGQWLYFVVVFDNGAQAFDADVARVRRNSAR